MKAPSLARRAPGTLLTVALAALATLVALHPSRFPGWEEALACRPELLLEGQLWRLISGPLVHVSAGHALRDLGALLALGLLFEPALGRRTWLVLAASTVAGPAVTLLADPDGGAYFGLSGTVHGVLGAVLARAWVQHRGRPPAALALLTLALLTKLALELHTGVLAWPLALPPGFCAAPAAHAAGALAGALCSMDTVYNENLHPGDARMPGR